MLRVLFISRPTLFTTPGGDTMQLLKTKEYLERDFNISIEIEPDIGPINYEKYDLIHFFNIIRPNNILPHIKSGNPYVISPIFVDYSEYDQKVRGGMMGKISKIFGQDNTEYMKSLARWVKNGEYPGSTYYLTHGYKKSVEKVLKNCTLILPNSESELNRIKSNYTFDCNVVIVPNAVDSSFFIEDEKLEKKGVICVARIEGLKNQLNLIRAVKETDLNLTIIGKAAPNHQRFFNACKEEANEQISFIDHIEQEELIKYYQKAKIHAMVSWFETTGLSSIEAAACGCNIVVSEKGDQRDYFKNEAFYADPGEVESIKKALLEADKATKSELLIQRINQKYTWQKTAEQTFKAYKQALK